MKKLCISIALALALALAVIACGGEEELVSDQSNLITDPGFRMEDRPEPR